MHKLERLAIAMAKMEGFGKVGARPTKNNNPGDLRSSPLPRRRDDKGFMVFLTPQEGFTALLTQLMLYTLRGMTLRQAINTYAPPTGADGGNATDAYLAFVSTQTGIEVDSRLMDLLDFSSSDGTN